jgi:hypothetical protein
MGHGTGDLYASGREVAGRRFGTFVKTAVLAFLGALSILSTLAYSQPTHRCAQDAIKQAKALLIFHAGGEVNVGVDDQVKVLAPLRNPVNRRQFFDVLEVRGYVYRANYQMRLIYAQVPGACALMGQEILERASP